MIAKDFIIKSINLISKDFSFLKFSYYHDEMSDAHFIQISPSEYFETYNEKFVSLQNEIILTFIEKFPYESLAFTGEEDLFEGEIPVFILCGVTVSVNAEISWGGNEIENLLNDYEADVETVAKTFNKISRVKEQQNQQIITGFDLKFKEVSDNALPQNLNTNIEKTSIINQDDPTYEMDDFSLAA